MTAEKAVRKVFAFEDFIATASKVKFLTVSTDEGDVRLGSLTPLDLNEWNELRETPEGRKVAGAVLIAKSLVNAEGSRVGVVTPYKAMDDAERGKIAQLQRMNLNLSETVLRSIFKLNGIGPSAAADAKND